MRVDLFDFDLPPERIALRPAEPRDAARLLIVRPHGSPRFEDRAVLDLPDQLDARRHSRRQRHAGHPRGAIWGSRARQNLGPDRGNLD